MKASWVAALAMSATMVGGAWADLKADVYNGWGIGADGKISTAGLEHVGTFIDPQIDHWDGTLGYRWNPLGVDERYTVTWAGYLLTPEAGTYEFRTVSDDGVQVFIGGQTAINNPGEQWYGESQGSVTLTAGAHVLDVRFYENFTYDGVILQWKKPGDADWVIVPAASLVTAVPEPVSGMLALVGLAVAGVAAGRRKSSAS